MHAGVEILEIEELVEGANDGIAEGGSLLFELLDAKQIRRPKDVEPSMSAGV